MSESLELSPLFFSFVREIKFMIVLIICFKAFLAQNNIARCYTTTQMIMLLITTAFFSGIKSSKEFFVNHIKHEPVLLTAEEIYSFMIAHQIHQLLHMQGCIFYFHGSIMGMYLIER